MLDWLRLIRASGLCTILANLLAPFLSHAEHSRQLAVEVEVRTRQIDEQRLKWIFSLFPAVEKFWNHPAGKLSGGQKQMLAVARAIVEPRELLIVDEPSKGLAPAIIQNMIAAFREL